MVKLSSVYFLVEEHVASDIKRFTETYIKDLNFNIKLLVWIRDFAVMYCILMLCFPRKYNKILNKIYLTISGKEGRFWRFLLCNLLHFSISLCFSGKNIFPQHFIF
jgi:hypothetical protein